MTITNALAGIAVEDIADAIDFYERLFGRKPDARPMADIAEWKTPGGGWIQVFADADRAGASALTLVVDDIAEELGPAGSAWHRSGRQGVRGFFQDCQIPRPRRQPDRPEPAATGDVLRGSALVLSAVSFRRRPESMLQVILKLDVCGSPRTWIPACAGITSCLGKLPSNPS
jgi:catechol 2,3-dioxygenase-like lactoylglutathione lyase family enzyme